MSQKCWNCGSENYINHLWVESCDDCGIGCNYHGGGPNEAYKEAMDRQHEEELEREYKQNYDE
jgi:hypothetical protein